MMLQTIVTVVLLLMLLLIIIFLLFLFKPWRFLFSSRSRSSIKGELERPLVADEDDDNVNVSFNQNNELPRDYDLEGACYPNESHFRSPLTHGHGLIHKQRLSPNMPQGDTLAINVISDPSEDVDFGQTLKLPPAHYAQIQKHGTPNFQNDRLQDFVQRDIIDQRSCLTLEVISGPSCGLRCSVQSTSSSRLPLTLGRVSPSDLLIKDSEVSGKHALIKWNLDKMKWELVDMGSLNGTFLNSNPINHPDTGSRHWGDPMNLANGDIITLGTTSKVLVHITSQNQHHIPFGVGMASDPMALRRGGKKLAMEDVCYCQWPLPGLDQFGIFGICDGHGGDGAAKSASKLFPEIIASILSDSLKRERVLSLRDASDILRDAFSQTEACMNHYYEGCTATVLLVWADGDENFFAQCANVGDSACVMSVNGKQIKMTEDHKIANYSERLRIEGTGEPLKDGETRLYGLNLARMLGDKFLKQQDSRFSSEPYISEVVHIDQSNSAFAVLASDGLWDVISVKKAIQLVLQMRERYYTERENTAEKIASLLLSEAKTLKTKDNTSVIFLDFDTFNRFSCKVES
ncbi:protein phosphatase 2C 70-like isoform X2 [Gastrolobium bilobum]|uniref:protein phosphatase 2C 70-like isoform X2 n=1 Tax=Gastrolobium bilobum TaxID=150636 RepID=UPI002AB28AE9|nr:protein phosphatase 2C 70-like isoform X2 [Gastrolobium bilobum]